MFLDFKNIYLPLHKFSCFNSKAGKVVAGADDIRCYLCDSVTAGFAIGAILAHFEAVFDLRILLSIPPKWSCHPWRAR